MKEEESIAKLKSENAELKKKLAEYESNPAAKFYKSLTKAFDEICTEIDNKTLNSDEDFTKSIIKLAEKSEIIFKGLKEGISVFQEQKVIDEKKAAKIEKAPGVAL